MKVGDAVTWKSQAGGRTKEKAGVIAEVVMSDCRPSRLLFPNLYKHSGCGYGRTETSYVVMVGKTAYWPRTPALNATNQCPHCKGAGVEN